MKISTTALLPFALAITPAVLAETVPIDPARWSIEAREHRIEEHLGRNSLFLKGGVARVDGVSFENGSIEFDVAFTGERGFMGGQWRIESPGNHEEFYVRPHQSGKPDANQYTPLFNGDTGWQLYHGEGHGAAVTYVTDEWLHVKIVFSGDRGEVYIGAAEQPAVVIHELKREVRPGGVGLTVGDFAPGWFSNFSYREEESPELKGEFKAPPSLEPGTVAAWSVSSPFDEAAVAERVELGGLVDPTEEWLAKLDWTRLDSESSGTANLARVARLARGSDTVFARVAIESDAAQTRKFVFGYSDRIRAYLNGRLIYAGSNDYRSRDFRYLGTIGWFDALYLPLVEGRNELWLAVSESFGGWGVRGRFEDSSGIAVSAPSP